MDTFRLAVIVIAIIVLIVFLMVAGSMIKSDVRNKIFPPVSESCPSGWTYTGPVTTDGVVTTNAYCTLGSGTSNTGSGTMKKLYKKQDMLKAKGGTFGSAGFQLEIDPKVTDCQKKEWANRNKIYWDGISNYNGCT